LLRPGPRGPAAGAAGPPSSRPLPWRRPCAGSRRRGVHPGLACSGQRRTAAPLTDALLIEGKLLPLQLTAAVSCQLAAGVVRVICPGYATGIFDWPLTLGSLTGIDTRSVEHRASAQTAGGITHSEECRAAPEPCEGLDRSIARVTRRVWCTSFSSGATPGKTP
jgi:hypothetical protein